MHRVVLLLNALNCSPMEDIIHESCALVPMRDGVRLAIEIWRPKDGIARPGVVVRTPYGRVGDHAGFVEAGFCVIVADARGTGASEGIYDYYNLDAGRFDGYDLVEWLAEQTWCNGRIAAVGGSANGIYAISTAAENPPHLQCLAVDVIPSDFYMHQWYPGGVLRSETRYGWCTGIVNRCAPGAVWDGEAQHDKVQRDYKAALQAQRYAHISCDLMEWAKPYFTQRERNHLWKNIDLTPKIAAITLPILFGGVYYDHFGKGTIAAHAAHQGPKHLSMQSGGVSDPLEAGGWDIPWDEKVAWLKYYLCDEGDCPAGGEHWYITGSEERLHFKDKATTSWKSIDIDGTIQLQHHADKPALSAVVSDPLQFDVFLEQEPVNYIDIDPSALGDSATILGHPRLHFRVKTNHQDAQLLARLCILRSNGETRMLNMGARRIFLDENCETTQAYNENANDSCIEFWTVGHQLQTGEKIRLVLSPSETPFWHAPDQDFDLEITDLRLELPILSN